MILIENETHKRLNSMGIKRPEYINEDMYRYVKFTLKHPIRDEILDEFNFTEHEYNKLDYSERVKFNKLDKTSVFDEVKYLKDLKKFNQAKDIYYVIFIKERLNVMKELDISENLEKVVDSIVSIKDYYFSDDINITDYETDILTELRYI